LRQTFTGGRFSTGSVEGVSQWQFRRTFVAALVAAVCTLNGEKNCGILPFFSPLSRSELSIAKSLPLGYKKLHHHKTRNLN